MNMREDYHFYYTLYHTDWDYEGISSRQLYPTRQQVRAVFKVLAVTGVLGDSFGDAEVRNALEPYDASEGLVITYPVKQSFIKSVFGQSADQVIAARQAGPGADITTRMFFFKDGEVMRWLMPENDSGTRFVIMTIDVGTPVEWGFEIDDFDALIELKRKIRADMDYAIERKITKAVADALDVDKDEINLV